MDPFSQSVQEWQTFYATIVASSATLVGLLFVALSVNPNALARANNRDIQILARHTFTSFLYMIGIGLTFLIPRQGPFGLGLPLLAIGIVGLFYTLADLRSAHANLTRAGDRRGVVWRTVPKAIALAMLLLIAIMLIVGPNASVLWLMIAPMMLLLISASRNTWVLLVAVQGASTNLN